MEILVTIILGALVGWIASKVMNTDAEQNWILNIVVGVVGAFLGNIIARALGADSGATVSEFSFIGLFWAFVGACALLALYNLATRKRIR